MRILRSAPALALLAAAAPDRAGAWNLLDLSAGGSVRVDDGQPERFAGEISLGTGLPLHHFAGGVDVDGVGIVGRVGLTTGPRLAGWVLAGPGLFFHVPRHGSWQELTCLDGAIALLARTDGGIGARFALRAGIHLGVYPVELHADLVSRRGEPELTIGLTFGWDLPLTAGYAMSSGVRY